MVSKTGSGWWTLIWGIMLFFIMIQNVIWLRSIYLGEIREEAMNDMYEDQLQQQIKDDMMEDLYRDRMRDDIEENARWDDRMRDVYGDDLGYENYYPPSQNQEYQDSESEEESKTVSSVLDGDTIKLSTGETVRLIGINAPEEGEKCYAESKEFLEDFISDKEITLEKDVEDKDQYGRLLRYVFADKYNVNYGMIYLGFAHKYEYGLNKKYSSWFQDAENEAKQNGDCLWKSEEINYVQDQCISITNFNFNAVGDDNYNLNDEYVTFKNACSYSIEMSSWTIKDETASHIYTIPSFIFQAGSTFTLFTGVGTNTNSALYWGRTSGNYAAVWNNNGDTLFLRDSNGNLVLTQSYLGY